jgi:AcrR family transcriptional regulator
MDTRERILNAAVRVFAEHGTRGATTRRIAATAEVNEVTLFRQFGGKDELLREALAWAAERVMIHALPAEPEDPRAELGAWCDVHLQGLYGARMLLRTSIAEHDVNPGTGAPGCEVPTRVAQELEGYVGRLAARGLARRDVEPAAATALLMGAILTDAMTRDIMPARYPFPLAGAAARYVDLFLRAIGADGTVAETAGALEGGDG